MAPPPPPYEPRDPSSLEGVYLDRADQDRKPTPCQQGVEEPEVSSASPRWNWARLLKRVFAM